GCAVAAAAKHAASLPRHSCLNSHGAEQDYPATAFGEELMPARRALAAFLALAAATASAETFPDRPVSMIVPYAAGGSSDVLLRLLGERLTQVPVPPNPEQHPP